MAVYRNTAKHFFACIDARIIRGNALSLAALALLTVLLDRPAWWASHPAELCRTLSLDARSLEPLLEELEHKGFLKRRQGRRGMYYDVYERPNGGPPEQEQQAQEERKEPPRERVEETVPPLREKLDWPDEPVEGQPMSDRNRAFALQLIRERFPLAAAAHDLNRAIDRDCGGGT